MPLALNTQNFALTGSDPFRRKADCTLRKLKTDQLEKLKDKPPLLAKGLTLIFRVVYYGFEIIKHLTVFALNQVERELHYLAFGG